MFLKLMGHKKSKPRRGGHSNYETNNDNLDCSPSNVPCPETRHFDKIHGTETVTCLSAFSPGVCLSGSTDKTIAAFDWRRGQLLQSWTGHEKPVVKVIHGNFRCGPVVISSSRDKTIRIWKYSGGPPIATYLGHTQVVSAIDLNQDNTVLCSGSRDNSVRLWDVNTGQCTSENTVTRNLVTCLKWVPKSHFICQTGEDKMLRIWDSRSLRVAFAFPPKQQIQTCCDASCDGVHVLTSSSGFNKLGCEATLWDMRQNKKVCVYTGHTHMVSSCAFLPQGVAGYAEPLIATTSHDQSIKIWNQYTQECLLSEFKACSPLTAIAIWEDGSVCIGSHAAGISQCALQSTSQGLQLVDETSF